MNREQREALIERLKVEKAATLADMAQRRAARDAVGDYDPLPLVQRSQPAQQFVYKMNPNALNDTPQPQPPQLSLLSRADLLATVDELGGFIGERERLLRDEINDLRDRLSQLRTELTIVRANIKTGNIGGRDAAF